MIIVLHNMHMQDKYLAALVQAVHSEAQKAVPLHPTLDRLLDGTTMQDRITSLPTEGIVVNAGLA